MKLLPGILGFSFFLASAPLQAAGFCGDLKNAFGPFDYTDMANRQSLELVEMGHFTPNIESLKSGNSAPIAAELAYTLAAFPNHHRALMSASNLVLRDKKLRPYGFRYPIECYFDRAIRFKSDDGIVRMAYAIYLSKSGNLIKAIEQLGVAVRLDPENALINYNLGLLYCKKKDFDSAKMYAEKAYALGFPLPGLKRMLTEAGKWSEPKKSELTQNGKAIANSKNHALPNE
jgi:tetratricopeptide (TPR) repeat protein